MFGQFSGTFTASNGLTINPSVAPAKNPAMEYVNGLGCLSLPR